MNGKQYIVMSSKKVVYISDIFVTEESARNEFEKALEVYLKHRLRK